MAGLLIPLLVAGTAAIGAYLLVTATLFGWRREGPSARAPKASASAWTARYETWRAEAGLDEVPLAELVGVLGFVGFVGTAIAFALFGGVLPALVAGAFAASLPLAGFRRRRQARRAAAQDAWPRLIDEIRILTSSVGRSIPQALFEAAGSAPPELRPAFAAAEREWRISTDFERTTQVLKARLGDPTADATCETLLVAYDLGGSDVDRRLADLADDRRRDAQYRKDAHARQAGVRFARRFVLIVPLGMALAGLSVGNGRAAYATPLGQIAVVVALLLLAACWVWAGRLLALPTEERVFP